MTDIADSATPLTLRLSLIDVLSRSVGGHVHLRQDHEDGFSLRVVLRNASATAMELAA